MKKNYIAPQMEVTIIESQSMMLESSPVPPAPKGDMKVSDKKTTEVW